MSGKGISLWRVYSVWRDGTQEPTPETVLFRFHGDRLVAPEATVRLFEMRRALTGTPGLIAVGVGRQCETPSWTPPLDEEKEDEEA